MINTEQLKQWRQAKTLAISNPNTDPETCIALQEMYIELKQLRRDNLKLLDRDDLFKALILYFHFSRQQHFLTPELEELIDEINNLADEANVDLETYNNTGD